MSPKIEEYDVLDVIGSGSFGTCFKVRHKLTKDLFVWKAIDYGKLSEESKKNLVSEVNLLSKLIHPNIVQYYDRIIHKETTTLYIITEWCQGGDLAKLVKNAKSTGHKIKEDFIWKVLYQVSKAVQVCHTTLGRFTVLHRDIKPANVFLDENGNAKLGDFGLARVLDYQGECDENLVGTPYYMSPEVIRGQRYNRKSDIWALGCLVYELCALSPPFKGCDLADLHIKIKSGKYLPIPNHYSENLVKVISFMLSVRHEYRPTIEMIIHHPLVVQNIKTSQRYLKKEVNLDSSADECSNALKNLSLVTEAEEVTQNLFKEKWMHRLEALREREAKLKEKEVGLAVKERTLIHKEKHLVRQAKETKNRLAFAELCKHRKKDPRLSALMNNSQDTEFSADPGDTSVLPTSAKLDPNLFPNPNFFRVKSERRSKQVTFTRDNRVQHKNYTRPDSGSSKSQSSDNSGAPQDQQRQPLSRLLTNHQFIKLNKDCSGSTKTLSAGNSNSTLKHKLWSQRRFSTPLRVDKENATINIKDGVVIQSNKKPDKTFKLIHFI